MLVVGIVGVYWQICGYEFLNFDDHDYVTNNLNVQKGFNTQSIKWAFSQWHAGNWHPVTWLSHMLDWALFEDDAGKHHIANIVFHCLNSILIFIVFYKYLKKFWIAAFVAAAFAFHPMHVESVAWISERKDLLSCFFWLMTMAAYGKYAQRPQLKIYLVVLTFLALGLLSKPMVVTLPCVLLICDFWPLKRFTINKKTHRTNLLSLILEKVPMFAMVVTSCIVTFLVQSAGGAVKSMELIPLSSRIANTAISYLAYIGKLVWPTNLAMFYPHPEKGVPMAQAAICAVILIAITIAIYKIVRKNSEYGYLAFGWLWYVGTLVPVVGLVQVGEQALADRYTYIPYIGLFVIVAMGANDIRKKLKWPKIPMFIAAVAIIAVWAVMSFQQQKTWKSTITLCEHSIKVTKDNYKGYFCMADPLREMGKIDEAIECNKKALEIDPNYVKALNSIGLAYMEKDEDALALQYLHKALKLAPGVFEVKVNIGVILVKNQKYAEALSFYYKALQQKDVPVLRTNIGYALQNLGKTDQAIAQYKLALQMNPKLHRAYNLLGLALMSKSQYASAVDIFKMSVNIDPNILQSQANLARAYFYTGQLQKASKIYSALIQTMPDLPSPYSSLAAIEINNSNYAKAKQLCQKSLLLAPDFLQAKINYAISTAGLGEYFESAKLFKEIILIKPNDINLRMRFADIAYKSGDRVLAVSQCRQAIELAKKQNHNQLIHQIEDRISAYQN